MAAIRVPGLDGHRIEGIPIEVTAHDLVSTRLKHSRTADESVNRLHRDETGGTAAVNRLTWSRLSLPMQQVCRSILSSALWERLPHLVPVVRSFTPDVLKEFVQSCGIKELYERQQETM